MKMQTSVNWRNWALLLSFGGGVWSNEEIGEYGARYGCEWYRCVIVGFLCVWARLEWEVAEPSKI